MQLAREVRVTRGLLTGRVRDRSTGLAAAGLPVVLGLRLGEPDELILARSVTDAEGIFRFLEYRGFRPGPHQWGIGSGTRWRQVAAGTPYSLIEPVVLTGPALIRSVALDPVTRLAGRVVQANGSPVANVTLTVAAAGSAPTVKTDASGLFSLSDRTADLFGFGDYAIGIPPSVQVTLTQADPQPAEAAAPVEVSLRPGDSKSVTIPMS